MFLKIVRHSERSSDDDDLGASSSMNRSESNT